MIPVTYRDEDGKRHIMWASPHNVEDITMELEERGCTNVYADW